MMKTKKIGNSLLFAASIAIALQSVPVHTTPKTTLSCVTKMALGGISRVIRGGVALSAMPITAPSKLLVWLTDSIVGTRMGERLGKFAENHPRINFAGKTVLAGTVVTTVLAAITIYSVIKFAGAAEKKYYEEEVLGDEFYGDRFYQNFNWDRKEQRTWQSRFEAITQTTALTIISDKICQDHSEALIDLLGALPTNLTIGDILAVTSNASAETIKAAYKAFVLKWHPDKVSSENQEKATRIFSFINEISTAYLQNLAPSPSASEQAAWSSDNQPSQQTQQQTQPLMI